MWSHHLKKVQDYTKLVDNSHPSLFIFFGLILPIIIFINFDLNSINSFSILLIFIGISLYILPKNIFLKFLLWLVVSSILFCFCNGLFLNNSIEYALLEGKKEIKATVLDFRAVGNRFNWLQNPNYIEIKINEYRTNEEEDWKKCSIKAIAKITNSSDIIYGESLTLSGYIITPDKPLIKGSFNYKNYLKSIGVDYTYYGKVEKKDPNSSYYNNAMLKIFNFRNNLLSNLCSGINNENVKTFLAGIIFGCRQNISQKTKDIFVNNGTVHILAISGLHVGILAVFLLLLFRFLPIKIRFLVIPSVLFLYVFLSGLQPSAVRAFVMISTFCIFRAFYLTDKPFNNILFAAIVLIISNPYIVVSSGFQFSFLITGLLVLSWGKFEEWKNVLFEKNRWIVIKKNEHAKKIINYTALKLYAALFTCTLAAIVSAGLTLHYQKLFIPLMPILNFIIVPLMFPLFFISLLKIVFTSLFGNFFNLIFNGLMCFFTEAIFKFSTFGNSLNTSIHTHYTPLIFIIVFYIFIIIFIFYKQKKVKLYSLLICTCIFVFSSCNFAYSENPKIYAVKPAGNIGSSYLFADQNTSTVNIINLPGNNGYIIKEFLKKHNYQQIDNIFLSKATKDYCKNSELLLNSYKVNNLILSKNVRKSKYLKKLINICRKNGVNILYKNIIKTSLYKLEIFPSKNTYKISSLRTGDIFTLKLEDSHYEKEKIILLRNNKTIKRLTLTNSNQIKIINF